MRTQNKRVRVVLTKMLMNMLLAHCSLFNPPTSDCQARDFCPLQSRKEKTILLPDLQTHTLTKWRHRLSKEDQKRSQGSKHARVPRCWEKAVTTARPEQKKQRSPRNTKTNDRLLFRSSMRAPSTDREGSVLMEPRPRTSKHILFQLKPISSDRVTGPLSHLI